MSNQQPELPLQGTTAPGKIRPDDPNIKFLVELLRGEGWLTARELIRIIQEKTQQIVSDRLIRDLGAASAGQIAGGQQGYKLVSEMTQAEYSHWRNWMSSQADVMKRRVLESDKVFYGRKPVEPGNGILNPNSTSNQSTES